jgi:HSP20 family protein
MNSVIKYNERPLLEGLARIGNFLSPDWAALDVEEDEDCFDIALDLPGVKKEDIEINYENNLLNVSAFRGQEHSGSNISERSWGQVKKSVSLSGVDITKSEASLEDGVLKICLPKLKESFGQQIEIK